MILYIDAAKFIGDLKKDLAKNLTKAGLYFVGKLREAVNRSQPYKKYVGATTVIYKGLSPSLPGEDPKKITGELQKSMAYKVDKASMILYVGSALDKAGYLQEGTSKMAARPFLTNTINKEKAAITSIILTGKK